jgi:predicted 3-demethylubiquinone-9 3-methyltransferase (glyoxalase superfamily)
MAKNTICLWYEYDAEEAARFYTQIFPNSGLGAIHRAPARVGWVEPIGFYVELLSEHTGTRA